MTHFISIGYLIRRKNILVFGLKSMVGEYVEMISSIEYKNIIWINPSRPFATEFATAMHF